VLFVFRKNCIIFGNVPDPMTPRFTFILSLISFLGVLALSVFIFLTPTKLVYVDSAKLVNEYKGMQDARKTYQQKATTWKANIDTLAQEVQQRIMSYEKESAKLSAKERKLSEELIRVKQKQLMDYQQAMNAQAKQEDEKMTQAVINEVNAYLKKYGKSQGYKIVMAATQYGNIAYADEGLDITEEVLIGLNKEYTGQ
jgi:outer membrane protein